MNCEHYESYEDDDFGVPDVLCLSSESDVVVDKLTPGNEEDRHCVVVETLVLVKIVKICVDVSGWDMKMKLFHHLMKMSRTSSG